MLYVKANLGNDVEIRVPLYGDEVFTICPVCGIEHQIEGELLIHALREGSTQIYCEECSMKVGK